MADEYTPTTEQVARAYMVGMRQAFIASAGEHDAEFTRWLAAHDREVAAKAWDEGFTRGFYSAQSMPSDADASESSVDNPYREGSQ